MNVYIVTKYVPASSIRDALRKEKDHQVDDCFLENECKTNYIEEKLGNKKLGFKDGTTKRNKKRTTNIQLSGMA